MAMDTYRAIKQPVEAMSLEEKGQLYLLLELGIQEDEQKLIAKMSKDWARRLRHHEYKWDKFFKNIGRDLTPDVAAKLITEAYSEGSIGYLKHQIMELPGDYIKILNGVVKILQKAFKVPKPYFKEYNSEYQKMKAMEEWIITNMLQAAWDQMPKEKKEELARNVENILREKGIQIAKTGELTTILMQGGLIGLRNVLGFQFHIFLAQFANQLARALVGRGLSFTANAALQRFAAIWLGPIGWVITIILTVDLLFMLVNRRDWKKIIPAVFLISMKRLEMEV